jgi:Holliday junction resolvase RusA-like endonuclease
MFAVLPMEPVSKSRPRVVTANGRTRTYTPARTVVAEQEVRAHLLPYRDSFGHGEPLYVAITFYMRRPRRGPDHPIKGRDLDNMAKLMLDALNGLVYPDDAQVVEMHVRKAWVAGDSCVHVRVLPA